MNIKEEKTIPVAEANPNKEVCDILLRSSSVEKSLLFVEVCCKQQTSTKKDFSTEDDPEEDRKRFMCISIVQTSRFSPTEPLQTELAKFEENVTRSSYKALAYRNAAQSLSKLGHKIESGAEAKKLKGIGTKIADKVDEILQTGTLRKLEEIESDKTNQAIQLLCKVSGIGPIKAHELVEKGITSIEKLREHNEELTAHQQLGLKYFEDFEKKIPRDEIREIEKIIKTCVFEIDSQFNVTICGSYRRKEPECGDIDVLISHPAFSSQSPKEEGYTKLNQVVNNLKKCHLITETISQGNVKYMGVCNLKNVSEATALNAHANTKLSNGEFRRIDIRICPYDQYYCMILHFTGSDLFNQQMRQHARKQNFTLNEYNLRIIGCTGTIGEAVPLKSEKDIFECIQYPYKKPEERNWLTLSPNLPVKHKKE